MKRIRAFLSMLLIFVCIFGAGCFEYGPKYSQGVAIDEYDPMLSSFSVTYYNLPEDFLDTCGYIDGKLYWDTEMDKDYFYLLEKMDRSLMWLSFEQAEYEEAKECILVDAIPQNYLEKNYNEYHFIIYGHDFPAWCTMICYNDQKNTLIFMGIYCIPSEYPDIEYGSTDFGLYLETFFGDFYDFDA